MGSAQGAINVNYPVDSSPLDVELLPLQDRVSVGACLSTFLKARHTHATRGEA